MGRFANTNCRSAQSHSMRPQAQCSVPNRISRGPIRRLLGRKQPCALPHSLLESPPITTTTNPDGTVTGSIRLPNGMDPSSINFRTSTMHGGKSMDYTVSLSHGKKSSEFYDRRNGKNFCKMSVVENRDGTHTVSFTLYESATKASLHMPGYTRQSFSAESVKAQKTLATNQTEPDTGPRFKVTAQQDGSLTGVIHLTPEQARANINFSVSKQTDTSRSSINSSLATNDIRARVGGMYDVRRTIKPDGSAILSMTLPSEHLKGEVSIGGDIFVLSSEVVAAAQDSQRVTPSPDENITSPSDRVLSSDTNDTTTETVQDEARSPSESSPEQFEDEIQNKNTANRDYLNAWVPPGPASGIFPIPEGSKVDISGSPVGLTHPAGVHLDGQYRLVRTMHDSLHGKIPVVFKFTPSTESDSRVEQIVALGLRGHVLYDDTIRFNRTVRVAGELPSNLKYYKFSQVRSDGSVLFSRLSDITQPGADLHIAAPQFTPEGTLERWKWTSVELQDNGSVLRKKY